ncbi:DNA adenine methylase [Rhodoluna sp. KAS3]|uniref:DNA adenine methylase n=1 Tax=Rhodoluna sp. KAS3 TaxID=942880 RepID=UPI0022314CE0|nr:DNA adenine methylase [Rhodoluna sp. KAS3]BDS49491.1 DNA adenine methylase [Rhodoluna sp. KAS3]
MIDQELTPSPIFGSKLSPFVKWPGGKSGELKKIALAAPKTANRFIEPFLGGGSVLLSIDPSIKALGNDIVPELVALYRGSSTNDKGLYTELLRLVVAWNSFSKHETLWSDLAVAFIQGKSDISKALKAILEITKSDLKDFDEPFKTEFARRLTADLPKKMNRIGVLQEKHGRDLPQDELMENIEGLVRASFYMAIRSRYNKARSGEIFNDVRTADFFFIREYCYASMFRFNASDEFNVPYGGVSYNRKDFAVKVETLYSEAMRARLSNAEFHLSDFTEFVKKISPTKGDFMFLDPPYDSDFTDYDNRSFDNTDQGRLAKTLSELDANIMIVIGDTPLIRSLYPETHWNIQTDAMFYKWTVKSRNNREASHLTITNYDL